MAEKYKKMDKEYQKLENEMMEKYKLNNDFVAEGGYHVDPETVVAMVKKVWNKFTDEERAHMCGVYSSLVGFFEISDNKGSMDVKCKTMDQLKLELCFKGIYKPDYEKYLKDNKKDMGNLDRYMLQYCVDHELKKDRDK